MIQENTEISEETKKKVLQLFNDNKLQINPGIETSQVRIFFSDDLGNDLALFTYGNAEEMFQDLDALYPNLEQVKQLIQDAFGDERLSQEARRWGWNLIYNHIQLMKNSTDSSNDDDAWLSLK